RAPYSMAERPSIKRPAKSPSPPGALGTLRPKLPEGTKQNGSAGSLMVVVAYGAKTRAGAPVLPATNVTGRPTQFVKQVARDCAANPRNVREGRSALMGSSAAPRL